MKVMKKQGVKFYLSHQVSGVERKGDEVTVTAKTKRARRYVYGRLLPDVCWAQTLYRRTWSTSRWRCGQ